MATARSRRRRTQSQQTSNAAAPRDARALIARVAETPELARAVAQLPARVLHGVIEQWGLEDCGELIALTSPDQLNALLDIDLWHNSRTSSDVHFDAARFRDWLELFAESGAAAAAARLCELDGALVATALAAEIAVFDPAAIMMSDDGVAPGDTRREPWTCEVGGYLIAGRHGEPWDTLLDVLTAMSDAHFERFHAIMRGCRRLSYSRPEEDGFHNLLENEEQTIFDLGVDRDERREREGYVQAGDARAFLLTARSAHSARGRDDPIFAVYARVAAARVEPADAMESSPPLTAAESTEEERAAVAAVVELLGDAGLVTPTTALLPGAGDPAPRLSRMHRYMEDRLGRDAASYAACGEELAFLSNVLVEGGSMQQRRFTPREAQDAVFATCNLGLDMVAGGTAPGDSDKTSGVSEAAHERDLIELFQIGLSTLHSEVCLFVADNLLQTLAGLPCADEDTRAGIEDLRRTLTRALRTGAPWLARESLDVLTVLDAPTWAALAALLDEYPVMLANVSAAIGATVHSVSTSSFEFIVEHSHLTAVHTFARSLPSRLA
jgi:hypothetical protein